MKCSASFWRDRGSKSEFKKNRGSEKGKTNGGRDDGWTNDGIWIWKEIDRERWVQRLGSLWDSVIEKRKEGGKEGEKKLVWEMDE